MKVIQRIPKIVIEGFKRPSSLKSGAFSILANGLSGFGSHGVPSTRVQHPISQFEPIYFIVRTPVFQLQTISKAELTYNTVQNERMIRHFGVREDDRLFYASSRADFGMSANAHVRT